MKSNFSLFDLPENGFGVLFFHKQLVMWMKNEKKIPGIRQTQKRLLSRRNGNRQTPQMAGKSWSRGHFHVISLIESLNIAKVLY